eukprot:CAMPEP_0115728816 /NCGR_PEP_ID=MMETSP0272-20121206/83175_1 /TAXON_ID=71861 /ORGANISM="Scrippsiella trochoidea, Strain CCMP3099" /LENGTH=118 /DNA_ID=CAMNT_0003172455 /DNA_START=1905 /DNA_END=2258 /DNA_ORIENTATION=-
MTNFSARSDNLPFTASDLSTLETQSVQARLRPATPDNCNEFGEHPAQTQRPQSLQWCLGCKCLFPSLVPHMPQLLVFSSQAGDVLLKSPKEAVPGVPGVEGKSSDEAELPARNRGGVK